MFLQNVKCLRYSTLRYVTWGWKTGIRSRWCAVRMMLDLCTSGVHHNRNVWNGLVICVTAIFINKPDYYSINCLWNGSFLYWTEWVLRHLNAFYFPLASQCFRHKCSQGSRLQSSEKNYRPIVFSACLHFLCIWCC